MTDIVKTEDATGLTSLVSARELSSMPIGLRILFHEPSRAYFEQMARSMADTANKMTPAHLKGDPQLCFAIIRRSLGWRMDPYEVAASTYSVHGSMGYYGKLIRGVMMNSGRVKEIRFEHGPTHEAWERVEGKFETRKGKRTDANGQPIMYTAAAYTPEDEKGLWCQATAVMHDGTERKTRKKFLRSCHPRNSTVWAYSPMKQIEDVLSRELAFAAVPDAMFGANFDVGLDETPEPMKDITPAPAPAPEEVIEIDEEEVIVEPPQQKKTTRLSFSWRGRTVYKTKFLRDITQEIAAAATIDDVAATYQEVREALTDLSPEHDALYRQVRDLVRNRNDALNEADEDENDSDGDHEDERDSYELVEDAGDGEVIDPPDYEEEEEGEFYDDTPPDEDHDLA